MCHVKSNYSMNVLWVLWMKSMTQRYYVTLFRVNLGEKYSGIQWWRHQMETFSALLDLCAGNLPVTGEFPTERPVTRSFDVWASMFSLIYVWINGWVNNGEAGDLICHRAHYDVTVMQGFLLFPLPGSGRAGNPSQLKTSRIYYAYYIFSHKMRRPHAGWISS